MSRQEELQIVLAQLEAAAYRKKFRRMDFFVPYPKQQHFFDLGGHIRERLLIAGNQLGKSWAGGFETSCHLTGQYPDWWLGRRFDRPTRVWAAGETSLLTRDVSQKILCGPPGVDADFGSGMIPKECLIDKTLARGVTDAYDTVQVKHFTNGVEDGISTLTFKSYEQGRKKFQGDTIDVGWGDEEMEDEIHSEFLTRVRPDGVFFITFTPLLGKTQVVRRFLEEHSPDRAHVTMTIDDVGHYTEEEKRARVAGYKAHEREARSKGVPMLGSGRIFTTPEEAITEQAITDVPAHWAKIWCIDFGIDHPFAAVLLLWDKDSDVLHVHAALRMQGEGQDLPLKHSIPMKTIGGMVPVTWPQDGHQRDKGSGEQIALQYRKHGLLTLPMHAQWPDGGNSTEAAISEMSERMETGRFKVAAHLSDWFEEYRNYHRKDGLIVKLYDDLISATQKGVMMKRFAKPVPLGPSRRSARKSQGIADGVDFDVFQA